MPNRYVKGHWVSLIIKEGQIKSAIRYHLIPARMAIIKDKKIMSISENVEKMYSVDGNVKWC